MTGEKQEILALIREKAKKRLFLSHALRQMSRPNRMISAAGKRMQNIEFLFGRFPPGTALAPKTPTHQHVTSTVDSTKWAGMVYIRHSSLVLLSPFGQNREISLSALNLQELI